MANGSLGRYLHFARLFAISLSKWLRVRFGGCACRMDSHETHTHISMRLLFFLLFHLFPYIVCLVGEGRGLHSHTLHCIIRQANAFHVMPNAMTICSFIHRFWNRICRIEVENGIYIRRCNDMRRRCGMNQWLLYVNLLEWSNGNRSCLLSMRVQFVCHFSWMLYVLVVSVNH